MGYELERDENPMTWEASSLAKKTLMMHDYGEFAGFRKPTIGELMVLREALSFAIFELQQERES